MPERRAILVPLFLVAQAALAHWAGHWERPPAPLDLSRFPVEFGGWKRVREDPISEVAPGLVADRLLSWAYVHPQTGSAASLFVAWYRSQLAGNSQPHSPRMCLPGSGWLPESTGEVTLDTAAGPITVNRWVIAKGAQRAAVLFWYQRPRRAVAGEWAAKFWLAADALRDKRTDTALVRVVVWTLGRSDDAAIADACGFARILYPIMRERMAQ
jgi:EpsI family protein